MKIDVGALLLFGSGLLVGFGVAIIVAARWLAKAVDW